MRALVVPGDVGVVVVDVPRLRRVRPERDAERRELRGEERPVLRHLHEVVRELALPVLEHRERAVHVRLDPVVVAGFVVQVDVVPALALGRRYRRYALHELVVGGDPAVVRNATGVDVLGARAAVRVREVDAIKGHPDRVGVEVTAGREVRVGVDDPHNRRFDEDGDGRDPALDQVQVDLELREARLVGSPDLREADEADAVGRRVRRNDLSPWQEPEDAVRRDRVGLVPIMTAGPVAERERRLIDDAACEGGLAFRHACRDLDVLADPGDIRDVRLDRVCDGWDDGRGRRHSHQGADGDRRDSYQPTNTSHYFSF